MTCFWQHTFKTRIRYGLRRYLKKGIMILKTLPFDDQSVSIVALYTIQQYFCSMIFHPYSEKLVMIKPCNWTYFAYIGLKRHKTIKCPTYRLFPFLLVASFDFRLSPFSIPQLQDTIFNVHTYTCTTTPYSHNCQDPVRWYCPFTKPFSHNCQDLVAWYCPFTKPFFPQLSAHFAAV